MLLASAARGAAAWLQRGCQRGHRQSQHFCQQHQHSFSEHSVAMVSATMLHVIWAFVLKCSLTIPVCLMLLRLRSLSQSQYLGWPGSNFCLPAASSCAFPLPSFSSYILLNFEIYFSLFLVKLPLFFLTIASNILPCPFLFQLSLLKRTVLCFQR